MGRAIELAEIETLVCISIQLGADTLIFKVSEKFAHKDVANCGLGKVVQTPYLKGQKQGAH
ncbi:hypothetical protein RCCS2_05634 [Roseobacter sp. CCS2]|nr:hypothetical protein RCCS2_05634 [Roseobacter sp. CCS2]